MNWRGRGLSGWGSFSLYIYLCSGVVAKAMNSSSLSECESVLECVW